MRSILTRIVLTLWCFSVMVAAIYFGSEMHSTWWGSIQAAHETAKDPPMVTLILLAALCYWFWVVVMKLLVSKAWDKDGATAWNAIAVAVGLSFFFGLAAAPLSAHGSWIGGKTWILVMAFLPLVLMIKDLVADIFLKDEAGGNVTPLRRAGGGGGDTG